MPYCEEEPDTGVDDLEVDVDILIEELEYSRKLVNIAEYDVHILEEDVRAVQRNSEKEIHGLEGRKQLAELAILACQDYNNNFLQNMFLRYGRTAKESLAYRYVTIQQIKDGLKKKIFTKRRRLDVQKHRKILCKKLLGKNESQYKEVKLILEGKKSAGDIMFRTNIINANLKRVARQTRELIQGISATSAYMDIIQDMAGKFGRIKDYLDEDHVYCSEVLEDLLDRIKLQRTEIAYLEQVFKDATAATMRAEKVCSGTSADIKYSHTVRSNILKELDKALEEHKNRCNSCIEKIVAINDCIKDSSDKCMEKCKEILPRYPIVRGQGRTINGEKERTSDFIRSYELLQSLTKARNANELIFLFKQQIDKAHLLQSTTDRLEQLLKTVLRPENDMFKSEYNFTSSQYENRRIAAEKTLKDLQVAFDTKVAQARSAVAEQRKNAQGFENFLENMYALNERIGRTYNTYDEDTKFLATNRTVADLLDLTAKNIRLATDELGNYFKSNWSELRDNVENIEFLEYCAQKLPKTNNRQIYDLVIPNRPEIERSEINAKFTTHSQFKNANERIIDRSHQAEAARLREANEKAEQEKKQSDPEKLGK